MTHPHHTTGLPCNCGFTKHKAKPRVNKFFTSEKDHHRNKALYNMRWGFPHKKGAVDPGFLEGWIKEHGPYLYHGTDPEAARSILDEGLYPHGEHPLARSKYVDGLMNRDFYNPRPNHTYLGTRDYLSREGHDTRRDENYEPVPNAVLRVDLRKLDPQNINGDEDHWQNLNATNWHPAVANTVSQHPLPSEPDYFDDGSGDTLGEWAERADLGSDPNHVPYSLEKGSIAHRGRIPPEAISLHEPAQVTAATDSNHWEGKMWHGNNKGLMGPVRTPFWTTSHMPEAHGFGDTVHPVSVRFKNPAYYFGKRTQGDIEMAQAAGNDGIVIHYPEDNRDPSDLYPARQWAICLDPGSVVPGHDHEWPYG